MPHDENSFGPRYTVVPCEDREQGAQILCNGHPYLRTAITDCPPAEHDELAEEVCAELNELAYQASMA